MLGEVLLVSPVDIARVSEIQNEIFYHTEEGLYTLSVKVASVAHDTWNRLADLTAMIQYS